jgi:glycosyl transferase family WbsX
LFRIHLRDALNLVESRNPEQRVIFLKSWNEWGEGNYLEPDQKFGRDYLNVIRREIYHPETEFKGSHTGSLAACRNG